MKFILIILFFILPVSLNASNLYPCYVVRVIDGDTVILNISLEFNVGITGERIRLRDMDAPEARGAEKQKGLIVKAYLEKLIKKKRCEVSRVKRGKYRWTADLLLDGESVSEHLIKKGYAKKWP